MPEWRVAIAFLYAAAEAGGTIGIGSAAPTVPAAPSRGSEDLHLLDLGQSASACPARGRAHRLGRGAGRERDQGVSSRCTKHSADPALTRWRGHGDSPEADGQLDDWQCCRRIKQEMSKVAIATVTHRA